MPAIVYEFSASGQDAVRRAFQTTAEAEEKAAAAHARAAKLLGTGAGGARQREQQQQERQVHKSAMAEERARIAADRAAFRAREKSIQGEERARIQSSRRVAQEEARNKRELEKIDRDSDKRFEKSQREREKAAAREAEMRRNATDAGQRDKSNTSGSAMKEFFGSMVAMRAFDKLKGTVESAAREAMALQESTNRLSINARGAGQEFVDPAQLRREFEAVAVSTPGQSAQEISEAIQQFVSLTGELKTGRESAGTFATVASATGAGIGDVSSAAASIFNQFGLKSKDEMKDVMASLTFQGKKGAFEVKDMAAQFQRLAAAGASFGLTGVQGVKTIGGLAQIARTGTGSAAQTTTAIENIFSNMIGKSALLKKEGVNVYDKKGRTRDVGDILIESIVKSGKNNFEKKSQVLQQVFGDQGIRGVRPLLAKYQTEFQAAQKNGATEAEAAAAGLKKLRETLDESINAPGAWAEVQKDAARAQQDISAQTTASWERVKQVTAEKLLPALTAVTPKLMKLFVGADGEMGPAMMAVSGFADGIGLAADAVSEFVDSLYDLGIIKRKPKSFIEQEEAEKKKLAKFDDETGDIYKPEFADQNAAANLDPSKAYLRQNMVNTIAGLHEKAWSGSGPGHEKIQDLTHDQFVAKYNELAGDNGDKSDWTGSAGYQRRVGQIASSLESDPNYDFTTFGDNKIGSDANEAQKRLVEDYRSQQIQGMGEGQSGKMAADMEVLASAAVTAAKALQMVANSGQASITGTSGPSVAPGS